MYLPQELIRIKRDGICLSESQIQQFVDGLVDGGFNDAQVGAMAMAIFQQGMSTSETIKLTQSMMHSGQVLSWQDIDGPIVDKHSTGGVGDKVSFMLAAIVSACGAYVPMISGRGLGHTGGTTDKLESIKGFDVQPSVPRFKEIVKKLGLSIITQTADLAPADRRLYGIRDITSTVESIPLITASILSKKLAAGLDALVMDVKVGNGAMMNNMADAQALAQSIVSVANGAGVKTQAIITDMNQVLGNSAGNALEIIETIDYLTGTYREPRLHQVVVALAEAMLINADLAADSSQAQRKIEHALTSGKAASLFEQMIAEMGGPNNLLAAPWQSMQKAKVVIDVVAPQSGVITEVDTRAVGMAIVRLGGGRQFNGQQVDHSVGFDQILPLGSQVEQGQTIARVHANDQQSADIAIKEYLDAHRFSEKGTVLSDEQQVTVYHTVS